MNTQSIIVVGGKEDEGLREALTARRVFSPGEVREALELQENTLWVARDLPPLHEFADVGRGRYRRALLLLGPVESPRRSVLETIFDPVVAPDNSMQILPEDQLLETLATDHREDYMLSGVYAAEDEMVLLYRGDLRPITISLQWFQNNPVARPDPEDLEIVDYGQGLRLGEFEVGTRTILYEFDANYRRRQKENRREIDDSLGGCLRRLRLLRGMTQKDFQSVTPRTIRRIEQGETDPRSATLEKIAGELGVEPDEICGY